ncbi:MAG: hypothetical protein Q7T73_03340 [Beijerinckiaceae bacterium]|nr:hypothetical protein [Beijerinckiaceae bacterium]
MALVVALAACGGPTEEELAIDLPSDPVDELSLHNDEFCPKVMPRAPRETYGFGTGMPATDLPAFPAFDEAWLCTYQTRDIAPKGSNGAWYEWVQTGLPRNLTPNELTSFSAAIGELDLLPTGDYACTADLGPRYLVSMAWERDLTGVVVDDYGCRSVRLTDDPFVTIPGDASQPGTVDGVLSSPEGLLADLGVGRVR